MPDLTDPMFRALRSASLRVDGCLCPIHFVRGSAQRALLKGLDDHGLITWNGPVPRINDAGRKAIVEATDER